MATVTISLPEKIAKKIDKQARAKGFATRSEFIRSILREHLDDWELEEFEPVSLDQLRAELAATGKYSEEFIKSVIRGFKKSSAYEK